MWWVRVRGGSISASHDTYTGTVTILLELTCHTGLLAATRGDLWEDGVRFSVRVRFSCHRYGRLHSSVVIVAAAAALSP